MALARYAGVAHRGSREAHGGEAEGDPRRRGRLAGGAQEVGEEGGARRGGPRGDDAHRRWARRGADAEPR